MVRELLTSRPSDPFSFMMGYIQVRYRFFFFCEDAEVFFVGRCLGRNRLTMGDKKKSNN